MILFLLHFIHELWHKLYLGKCFWIARLEIKWEHKNAPCWKCKFFEAFYYDNYTFDCKKHKTLCWWMVDRGYCLDFKRRQNA